MKKRCKKLLSLLLSSCMVLSAMSGISFAASDTQHTYDGSGNIYYRNDDTYLIEKLTNPTQGEREADGLVEGGDRYNSYAWSMQELSDEYGKYVYIS